MQKTVAPLTLSVVTIAVNFLASVLSQHGIILTDSDKLALTNDTLAALGIIAGVIGIINHVRSHRVMKAQVAAAVAAAPIVKQGT